MTCTRCQKPTPVLDKGLCGMCWAMGQFKQKPGAPSMPMLPQVWTPPGYVPDVFFPAPESSWPFQPSLLGMVDNGKGYDFIVESDWANDGPMFTSYLAKQKAWDELEAANDPPPVAPKFIHTQMFGVEKPSAPESAPGNPVDAMMEYVFGMQSPMEMIANTTQRIARDQRIGCGECAWGVAWHEEPWRDGKRAIVPRLCQHLFKEAKSARICA